MHAKVPDIRRARFLLRIPLHPHRRRSTMVPTGAVVTLGGSKVITPVGCRRRIAIQILSLCVLLGGGLVQGAPSMAAEPWRRTAEEDGVVLETREVAGQPMPEFRGTAVISAELYDVASVVDDLNHYCEWNKRCAKALEYQRISETERVFYTRSGAPWPLSDRDAVLLGRVSGLAEGNEVVVRFEAMSDPRWPPIDGVVRMPLVKGHWRLVRVDAKTTKVEYQVQADPGGIVPGWAAKLSARQVPRDTLAGLRRQVAKSQGRYTAFLNRWRDKPAKSEAPPAVPAAPAGN